MPQLEDILDGDYGKIIVGAATAAAKTHNSILTIVAGDNITLDLDTTTNTLTITGESGGVAAYDTADMKRALSMGGLVTLTTRFSPSCENQFLAAISMGGFIETTPFPESFDINALQAQYAMGFMQ